MNNENKPEDEEDDEFDKLDHIIESSGCAKELELSKECFFERKDWRLCTETTEALRTLFERLRSFISSD